LLIAALLLVAATPTAAQTNQAVFSQIDDMVKQLSEITGWKVQKRVPSEFLSREKFKRYVQDHTKGRAVEKEIHAEETTLKMFGLVPGDFNLAQETVELLGEQAAAFYDYKKKRLFILDTTREGDEQRTALVHELAHALADQRHDLGKYLERGSPDSDQTTAREAVMEGQATWLTWAFESKRLGGKAEVPAHLVEQLTKDGEPDDEYPVLAKAPLYIRESLLFPYNTGARFQDAVYRKWGRDAFEKVFERAPGSTQQVIHPEEYFRDRAHSTPDPPSLEAFMTALEARQYKGLVQGTLGEFDHAVLLRQYIGSQDSALVATHWKGATYRLYEHKKRKYPVLDYVSDWDSPQAAQAYFRLYLRVLNAKWKGMDLYGPEHEGPKGEGREITGIGDSGKFVLRISGSSVQCLEGLPPEPPTQNRDARGRMDRADAGVTNRMKYDRP
jgi:hypothetical protein